MNKLVDMNEFLLWSNCSNSCKFCWQKKIADSRCILSEEDMLDSIKKVKEKISSLSCGDILLVGGEILEFKNQEISDSLINLFTFIKNLILENKIRYFFINTNLLYRDITLVAKLCKIFSNLEDRLKFTTSYDPFGRFSSKSSEDLFLQNLLLITSRYPKINVVVNTILTKQVCNSSFSVKEFCEKYSVRLVNLIPYIPIAYGDELTPSYGEILAKLLEADSEIPGYFESYVKNFDINQTKILWEYHKDIKEYEECTASYLECGHNKNFTKILKNNECFICKLREELNEETF